MGVRTCGNCAGFWSPFFPGTFDWPSKAFSDETIYACQYAMRPFTALSAVRGLFVVFLLLQASSISAIHVPDATVALRKPPDWASMIQRGLRLPWQHRQRVSEQGLGEDHVHIMRMRIYHDLRYKLLDVHGLFRCHVHGSFFIMLLSLRGLTPPHIPH